MINFTKISPSCTFFNYSDTIDKIANYFYAADSKELKQLQKPVLYSIICNSNLQITSEDSLFDFINEIFTNEGENDDIISFYEQIEFCNLSDENFHEFIENLDPSQITNGLWSKL